MRRPLSLTIIAWLFILVAVLSALNVSAQFGHGRFSLSFLVLLIFVGRGLLKIHSWARKFALASIALGWIVLAVFAVCGLFHIGELHFGSEIVTGWKASFVEIAFCNAFGIFLAWMTWALLRRETKELFQTCAA